MSTPDKLLGGHATGTLTDEEKARLYSAALEDQALFDQLMDEEALRDLLADPLAKARLLETLAPPRTVPFHRRPWVLGTAASLLLGLATTWNVLRTKPAPPQPSIPPRPIAEAPTVQAAPAPAALKAPAPEKADTSPRASLPAAPVPPAPKAEAAPAPVEAKALLGATVAREEKPAAAAVPAKEETRTVEVVVATAVRDMAKVETALQASKRTVPAVASLPLGKVDVALPPQWRLEEAGEGRKRLHLTMRQGGHPYLLCRTEGGVKVVEGEGSGLERTWLLQPTPRARWDLYVLPKLTADPSRLPEKGLREGWQQRLPL